MLYSIKTVHDLFKHIADNHLLIKEFGFGKDRDINDKNDMSFPLLFLISDMRVAITVGGQQSNLKEYGIRFYVLDKAEAVDKANELNLMANCELIGQQILATLQELKKKNIYIAENAAATHLIKVYNSNLVGCVFEIALQVPSGDKCELPYPPDFNPNDFACTN